MGAASSTADARNIRVIESPEGVPLRFEVAAASSRLGAFLLDTVIIHVAIIIIVVVALVALGSFAGPTALSLVLVSSFLLRNFYFTVSEMLWAGQTVGKRALSLRVITRDGGPLTAEAILARNLTRDLEFFLPMQALATPEALVSGAPPWTYLIIVAWLLVFALLPAFNRDRLRCGDLVGGTLVVRQPKAQLLEDLSEKEVLRWNQKIDLDVKYPFSEAQLDLYGEHELQLLEQVLRREEQAPNQELLQSIGEKIRAKIGWSDEVAPLNEDEFLQAFYRAQRARLEQQMLFGKRRKRKVR